MANPPITIGPFVNVPAPGSPIASAWPQTISTWLAQRFPSRLHGAKVTVNTDASGNATVTLPAQCAAVVVSIDRPTYAFHLGQGRELDCKAELSANGQQINMTFYGRNGGSNAVPAAVAAVASYTIHYIAIGGVNPP